MHITAYLKKGTVVITSGNGLQISDMRHRNISTMYWQKLMCLSRHRNINTMYWQKRIYTCVCLGIYIFCIEIYQNIMEKILFVLQQAQFNIMQPISGRVMAPYTFSRGAFPANPTTRARPTQRFGISQLKTRTPIFKSTLKTSISATRALWRFACEFI